MKRDESKKRHDDREIVDEMVKRDRSRSANQRKRLRSTIKTITKTHETYQVVEPVGMA